MTEIRLSTTLLRVAATCVSTEETRYYLNGVHVVPAPDPETGLGAMMVATDGHRLSLVWDESGFVDSEHLIQIDWKAKELKATKGQADRVLHVTDDLSNGGTMTGAVRLGYEADDHQVGAIMVTEIDGTFPDWTRVIPQGGTCESGYPPEQTFNPTYLKAFEDAYRLVEGERHAAPCIGQKEHGAPAWVWRDATPHVVFVCMPMRAAGEFHRPAFIDYATRPAAQCE